MSTKVETAHTERISSPSAALRAQLYREMADLCHELTSLQERALMRIEAVENDLWCFDGEGLYGDMKDNFKRLQRLLGLAGYERFTLESDEE
jgi:hypothetical protein